jgi:hypothetical protein
MSLIPFILSPSGGAPATPTGVQLAGNNFRSQGSGTVYSGLKLDSDGSAYERQPGGGWSRVFTWLFSGTNSAYYVNRTIVSGSLTTDAGTGSSITLGTDRIWDIQETGDTFVTVNFELALVSDDSVVASRTYDFQVLTTT